MTHPRHPHRWRQIRNYRPHKLYYNIIITSATVYSMHRRVRRRNMCFTYTGHLHSRKTGSYMYINVLKRERQMTHLGDPLRAKFESIKRIYNWKHDTRAVSSIVVQRWYYAINRCGYTRLLIFYYTRFV